MGHASGIRRIEDRSKRVLAGYSTQIPQRESASAALEKVCRFYRDLPRGRSFFSRLLSAGTALRMLRRGKKEGALKRSVVSVVALPNRPSVSITGSDVTLLHSKVLERDGGSTACVGRRR